MTITHSIPEGLTARVLNQTNFEAYAAQIVMPAERVAMLPDLMESRGMRMVVAVLGGEVVSQVLINPDSPTLEATRKHIPYPTPSLSFAHTPEPHRGRGYASFTLKAACNWAAAMGHPLIYLTVENIPYRSPHQDDAGGTADAPLADFYGGRGFEDWGRDEIEQVHYGFGSEAGAAPRVEETTRVMIRSLVPGVAAHDLLLPLQG